MLSNEVSTPSIWRKLESKNCCRIQKRVKHIGMIKSDGFTFSEHSKAAVSKEARQVITPLKALTLSSVEYCFVLTSPFEADELNKL